MIKLKRTICTAMLFLLICTCSLPTFSEVPAPESGNNDYSKSEIVVVDENSNNEKINLSPGQMLNVKLKTAEGNKWVEENEEINISLSRIRSFVEKNTQDQITYTSFVFIAKDEQRNITKVFKCMSSTGTDVLKTVTLTISIVQPETFTLVNRSFSPRLYLIKGQRVKIVLDSNATTGCSWNYKTQLNTRVLNEIASYYVCIPCQSEIAGSGGYQYFIFEAVESGDAYIDLEYKQPWNKQDPPYNTFDMNITVDPVANYPFPTSTPSTGTIMSNENVLSINKNDNGNVIALTKGQTLSITLPCDESGKSRWIYGKVPDSGVLREKLHGILYLDSFTYPAAESRWEYTAINTGTTNIGFAYADTNNLSMDPKDFFFVSVKVIDYIMPIPSTTGNFIKGTIKTDINSELKDINKGFKVQIVESGIENYTDENGCFNLSFASSEKTNLTLKITKDNYLTRTIKNVSYNSTLSTIEMWAGDIMIDGKSDGAINMADVLQLAKVFGSTKESTEYKSNCDLNYDGAVNMSDIFIIAKHFNCTSNSYTEI